MSSFEFDKITGALGRELIHSPEIERAVKLALARLTAEERELVVTKIKIGVPTTASMRRFNIGSARSCESIYQRILTILRIYVSYFAQADNPNLWQQLPRLVRVYGHILWQIFSGHDRNCLIAATDHTREELDAMIDCAAKAAESIHDTQIRALVEASVALYQYKRLGSTPPKRNARPERKPYKERTK